MSNQIYSIRKINGSQEVVTLSEKEFQMLLQCVEFDHRWMERVQPAVLKTLADKLARFV